MMRHRIYSVKVPRRLEDYCDCDHKIVPPVADHNDTYSYFTMWLNYKGSLGLMSLHHNQTEQLHRKLLHAYS